MDFVPSSLVGLANLPIVWFKYGVDPNGMNFHRVFVYDDPLRQYVENNLNKSDRILVTGQINHITRTE